MLVRSAGLEPATWNLVGTCSIQLSYERPQWGRPGTSRPPLVDGVIFPCATARTGLTVLLDGFVTIPCRRALFRFSVGRGFLYPPPVGAEILKIGGATQACGERGQRSLAARIMPAAAAVSSFSTYTSSSSPVAILATLMALAMTSDWRFGRRGFSVMTAPWLFE